MAVEIAKIAGEVRVKTRTNMHAGVWFLSSALSSRFQWGPLHKYYMGLPYCQFSKIQDKDKVRFCVAREVARTFFQTSLLSVLSLLSLPLTLLACVVVCAATGLVS